MQTKIREVIKGQNPVCIITRNRDPDVSTIYSGPVTNFSSLSDLESHFTSRDFDIFHQCSSFVVDESFDAGRGVSSETPCLIAVCPFSQIKEKGYEARSNGEPVITMSVHSKLESKTEQVLDIIQREFLSKVTLSSEPEYFPDRETYKSIVESIYTKEIGGGEGSSFVTPRLCSAHIIGTDHTTALTIFRSILLLERGAYWTFLFFDGNDNWFVGASPEMHLVVRNSELTMTPISGTYRKPQNVDDISDDKNLDQGIEALKSFLHDRKEINELFMVTDEELKMMCRICPDGGDIIGPILREMRHVIHTEYQLSGKWTDQSCPMQQCSDICDACVCNGYCPRREFKRLMHAYRTSMFAATVTGSPMGNACKRLLNYESQSRSYYSGAMFMIGVTNDDKKLYFDSCILIRTMELHRSGLIAMRVGATLVRDSDPEAETAETEWKLKGVLQALQRAGAVSSSEKKDGPTLLMSLETYDSKKYQEILEYRNKFISRFWKNQHGDGTSQQSINENNGYLWAGKKAILINNEDDFVFMMSHMLNYAGIETKVVPYNDINEADLNLQDLVIMGPGPGDPCDATRDKMIRGRDVVKRLFQRATSTNMKLICVCLGHQLLGGSLGLSLKKKAIPFQGVQVACKIMDEEELLGLYNSFYIDGKEGIESLIGSWKIDYYGDDEIMLMRTKNVVSCQFHPESLLTSNGFGILVKFLEHLFKE